MAKAEFKQWMYTYPMFNVVCPNECGEKLQNRTNGSYDWTEHHVFGYCEVCDIEFEVPYPTIIDRNMKEQIKRGVY